ARAPSIVTLSARSAPALQRYLRAVCTHLERGVDAQTFADLAYASQIGRIAFEHRLAIVAADAAEFAAKAARWLARGNADGVHAGRAGTDDALAQLLTGDAGGRFVDALVQAGEWEKLASLWVRGCAVEWQRLHGAGRRRVS